MNRSLLHLFFSLAVLAGLFFLPVPGGEAGHEITSQKTDNQFFTRIALNRRIGTKAAENQFAEQKIQRFMQQWELPAVSFAAAYQGKIIYINALGFADKESKELARPDHIFRIASASKLLTAAAVLQLADEGVIRLDDPVFGPEGLLPDEVYQKIAKDDKIFKITVRHLLEHTAGWRNKLRSDPMFAPVRVAQDAGANCPPDFETTLQFMLAQKDYFEPGTFYDYSNFGYCLLGRILERITGRDYETYMRENLFIPQGLTSFRLSKTLKANKLPGEVSYYDHPGALGKPSVFCTGDTLPRPYGGNYMEPLGPAGAWAGTASELLLFALNLENQAGEKPLLSDESLREMSKTDSSRVIGWRSVNENYKFRSGTLAGSNAIVSVGSDGLSWVMLTNGSTWRGPRFCYTMNSLGREITANLAKVYAEKEAKSKEKPAEK